MTREHSPSPRLTRWIAAFLAVLSLLALVAVIVELAVLRPSYNDVRAEQQNRTDAVRVAQQFTAEVNSYGVDSIDQYQEHITPLLSTKFQGEFKKAMTDIVASVKQAKMTSTGDVLASAVSSVDPDSAQVLVVADANVKTVFDTRARHFRWEVSLVKVDDKWLVDDFEPVA